MFKKNGLNEIGDIKNKVVDLLMVFYLIFSIPLIFLSISRSAITGWALNYSIQIVLFIAFCFVVIFRHKIHYKLKAIVTAIILLVFFVTGIHFLGLLSSGVVFLLLVSVFSSLFIGLAYGYASLAILVTVFFTYGLLYQTGMLKYTFDVEQMLNNNKLWITIGITYFIASYSIVFIVGRLEGAYTRLLEESKKSEEEYKLLFDQANEGVIITTIDGRILLVNDNFRLMSGYENSEVVGRNLSEMTVADDLLNKPLKFEELASGKTVVSERRVYDKQGNIRDITIKGNKLPDGRLQFLIKDVSKQKQIEKEIEAEREFGKTLVEAMPGVFYVFENYDKLVQWNNSLLHMSGYTADEIQKVHPNSLFDNANYESDADNIGLSEKKGSAYYRADLITKNGERIPLYNSAISYKRNNKIYLLGVGYDISNLVIAEKALKNSEINFRNIYNNTSDAIFIYNHDFKILSANERFYHLTGLDPKDIDSINFFDFLFDQNALQKVASEVEGVDKGRVVVAEYMIKNQNGRSFPIEVRSRPIVYQGQNAVVTSFNDISARKNLEKQVYTVSVKAEEDERGRIAKDLHDGLGPLLSTCKIYLHNLKNAKLSEKESMSFSKLSELINESLTGVKEISNNLSPHILRNFGLEHALKSFIEKLSLYTEISIATNLNTSKRYNEIIEITLYRVVTELINNTIKHAKAGNISVSIIEEPHKLLVVYIDDGQGFDYEQKIEENKGLGLFNMVSRINSVGGNISFKKQPQAGIVVNIEIPV